MIIDILQIEELERKIRDTKPLLEDPGMAELAKEELAELEKQKKYNRRKSPKLKQ